MKKENIIGIVIYLLVFAVAIVYGFTVLQTHFSHSSIQSVGLYAVYIIVSVFGGVFVTGVLQEFGHFLGAKTGGYDITFWSLFYLTFYIENGKRRFGFKTFNGLTGETRIVPNYDKKAKPNPYPYIFYGTIFNVAWVAACTFLFIYYNKNDGIESDVAYFFLTMGIIALMATIYNILPIKSDSVTDGYRLSQIKGDVDSFNELLVAENGGAALKKDEKEEETAKKPAKFIPEAALLDVYVALENKNYDEAFGLINKILEAEKETSNRIIFEAKAQYIYAMIFSKEKAEYEAYYDNEVSFAFRRDLSNDYSLSIMRVYLLTAGLLDGSQSEVLLTLKRVLKAYKALPTNRRHTELVLFNEALDKVIEAHPKWEELPNYKLYE